MIKDILVHIDVTRSGQRRLGYALRLAEQHGAYLTVAHVTPPPDTPTVFKPSMVESATEAQEERNTSDAQHARQYFDMIAQPTSPNATWLNLSGDLTPELSNAARYADLVIVGQYERQTPIERHPLSLGETLVLECGRPVLVVPGAFEASRIRRALVAWDGTPEAVRALHDALPLLRQDSPSVEVALLLEDGEASLQSLDAHLRRHQIEVQKGPQLAKESEPAEALSTRLKDGHFDFLVMGAYSRPAWLELLFGGTTPAALMQSTVPILISH